MTTYTETEVGDTLETKGRTITEADLVNFAGVSGDFNDLHLDAEKMSDSDFGGRIAQGSLVFSVMTGLLWQARPDQDLVALYGIDRLRFRLPVYPGDTIHVEIEAVEKDDREHPRAKGVIRYEAEVVNQSDAVVLSCELIGLYE